MAHGSRTTCEHNLSVNVQTRCLHEVRVMNVSARWVHSVCTISIYLILSWSNHEEIHMSPFKRDLKFRLNLKNHIDDVNKINVVNPEMNPYFLLHNIFAVLFTYWGRLLLGVNLDLKLCFLRGSATFNWHIFYFFYIFQKCYFFILYTFLSKCVNFQGNLIFFLGKINKIKSYYDLRKTRF